MKSTLVIASLVACRVAAVQLQGWGLAPADAVALVQLTLNNHTALVQLTLSNHTAGDAAALARSSKGCCCYMRSRCNQKLDCVALRENGNDGCPTATLHHHEFVKAETCYQRVMGYGPIGQAASAVKTSHPAYDVADFCQDPVLYDWINSFAGNVFLTYDENKDHKLSTDEFGRAFVFYIKSELLKKYPASKSGIETLTPERLRNGHGDAIHRHDLVLLLMRAVTSLLDKDSGASLDLEDNGASSARNSTPAKLAKQDSTDSSNAVDVEQTNDIVNVGEDDGQKPNPKDSTDSSNAVDVEQIKDNVDSTLSNVGGDRGQELRPVESEDKIKQKVEDAPDINVPKGMLDKALTAGGSLTNDDPVKKGADVVKGEVVKQDNVASSDRISTASERIKTLAEQDPLLYHLINGLVGRVFKEYGKDKDDKLSAAELEAALKYIRGELSKFKSGLTPEGLKPIEDQLKLLGVGQGDAISRDDLVLALMGAVNSLSAEDQALYGFISGFVGDMFAKHNKGQYDKLSAKTAVADSVKEFPSILNTLGVESKDGLTQKLMNNRIQFRLKPPGDGQRGAISRDDLVWALMGAVNSFKDNEIANHMKGTASSAARNVEIAQDNAVRNKKPYNDKNTKKKPSKSKAAAKPSKYFPWLRNLRRVLRAMKRSRA